MNADTKPDHTAALVKANQLTTTSVGLTYSPDVQNLAACYRELSEQLEAKEEERKLHERAAHDSDIRCQAAVRSEKTERTAREEEKQIAGETIRGWMLSAAAAEAALAKVEAALQDIIHADAKGESGGYMGRIARSALTKTAAPQEGTEPKDSAESVRVTDGPADAAATINATQEEKSAAFEWLRTIAIGTLIDARHAAILLQELAHLNASNKAARIMLRAYGKAEDDAAATLWDKQPELYGDPFPAATVQVPREPCRHDRKIICGNDYGDDIAWCDDCGEITFHSDADNVGEHYRKFSDREKWFKERVIAFGCQKEANLPDKWGNGKRCEIWCNHNYCPVSLRPAMLAAASQRVLAKENK